MSFCGQQRFIIIFFLLHKTTQHSLSHFLSLPHSAPLHSSPSESMSSAAAAAATSKFVSPLISHPPHRRRHRSHIVTVRRHNLRLSTLRCQAAEVSVAENAPASGGGRKWVPVVPLGALPKGERRVIIQDGDEILLLWYKDQVYAIENRSPAEGAYTEGLINAKLTQDGCIVCPSTDSTFDLRTGEVKEWYPKNPVLRLLTPVLRTLYVYPAKIDEQNIYISIAAVDSTDASAEIVFSGRAQPGMTASDVNVDEVRMVVDEGQGGFGFTRRNELINGKAAAIGFLLLLDFELLTGEGLLKGTGFLDFIYSISNALNN